MADEPFRLASRPAQTPKEANLERIRASKVPFREANKGECLCFREPGKPQIDFYPSTGRWRDLDFGRTFDGGAETFLAYYRNATQPQPQHKDTTMPKLSEMFPSNYLKASDIDDDSDLILTIDGLQQVTLGQGAKQEEKWAVGFRETNKLLVLNKTNTNTIAKLYGDDTDEWEGCKIALFATEVDFQGSQTLAIRVRARTPKVTSKGEAKPETKQAATDAGPDVPPAIVKLLRKYELSYPYDAKTLDAIKDEMTDKDFMALVQHMSDVADIPF